MAADGDWLQCWVLCACPTTMQACVTAVEQCKPQQAAPHRHASGADNNINSSSGEGASSTCAGTSSSTGMPATASPTGVPASDAPMSSIVVLWDLVTDAVRGL